MFIALAPVCYLTQRQAIHVYDHRRRSEEFVGFHSPIRSFLASVCSMRIGYVICAMLGIFPITGFNEKELEPDFLPVLMGHFPAGTSRKNLNHFAQIGKSKRFADYAYGTRRNIAVYGKREPPLFPLNKVTMKVVIFTAKNDRISTLEDVRLLTKQLPNVVKNIVLKRADFNHLDFVMGRTSYEVVFPQVLHVLKEFNY